MMRCGAGLDPDQAWRELLKERQNMPALQLTADNNDACRIDAMDLKDRLCDVETDGRDRFHASLPQNRDRPSGDHFNGTYVPVGGAVHSIMSGLSSPMPPRCEIP